ncbi:DUF5302 domain-containing protein [Jatrophihabitans sp.]|uniref:DUF5302 domain-containing protein n=1 Tax=Jatrophihabitans sp. TaxID=1932789 RepID=UPI0030C6896F|nr:hypothetical protein [Jatrophihabitans sp.]
MSDEKAPDPKDAFKAALERKQSKQHAHNAEAQSDSKVHGSSSRAGAKRTFRRKSGG